MAVAAAAAAQSCEGRNKQDEASRPAESCHCARTRFKRRPCEGRVTFN